MRLCATFLIPALGQGLLISAATKNQFLASQLALISAFLPAFLLSGFLFEIDSMPTVDPVDHDHRAGALPDPEPADGVPGRRHLADVRSAPSPSCCSIGAIFFVLAARSTRKRIG